MITSIANMELKAYRELHCYQYLIKPYQEDDIAKLIGKLLFLSQSGETREPFILVKNSGVNYKLFCKDILCIKAIPRGVNVVMRKEELKSTLYDHETDTRETPSRKICAGTSNVCRK